MFSIDEPPPGVQTERGLDTPECALKWDKDLKANAWCNMGADRMELVTYRNVEMWSRLGIQRVRIEIKDYGINEYEYQVLLTSFRDFATTLS